MPIGGTSAAFAQGASADAVETRSTALPDAAAWFGEAGRAGWSVANGFGLGFPPVLAGHARGGWRLVDDGRAPEGGPFPGLPAALPALAGYDSLGIEPAATSAPESGPAGTLARVLPAGEMLIGRGRPLATFAVTNGDFGRDETSLTAERGGERGGIRIENFTARRGEAGPYGLAGRHRWGATLEQTFGNQWLTASFRQAGVAARLRSHEEQSARGASGRVGWRRIAGRSETWLALSRQWDVHESFGGSLNPISRRDAQEVRAQGGASLRQGSRRMGFKVDWHRALVRRDGPSPVRTYGGDDWGGVFVSDEAPARRLRAELDAGRIGAVDRIELAPGLHAEWRSGTRRVETWARRLIEPVWHDLDPAERPFLQNTWAAGLGVGVTGEHGRAALRALGGRTRDRALLARRPLEEQWLRAGARRDRDPWNFAQVWGEARQAWGGIRVGGEASGLLRAPDAEKVDPAITARAFGEWAFVTFGGDLHVLARLEADAVGERATDQATPRELPGYVTGNATLGFGIGDARITLRVRNLENGTHEDVWIDAVTGEPARDTPRELRIAVAWTLRN